MGNTANNKPRRGSIDDDFGHNSIVISKKKGFSDSDSYSTVDKKSLDILAYQLKESKLNDPGNNFLFESLSNQDSIDDTSAPQTIPTVFKWDGGGNNVYISGTFNQWKSKIPMVKSENNFYTIIDLPLGNHQFKYIVDGQWRINKSVPVINSANGANNQVEVKATDFDVLEVLTYMESMQSGGNTTPPGEYNQKIPNNPTDAISMMPSFINSNKQIKDKQNGKKDNPTDGEGNNVTPLSSDFKKLLNPPALPPQLLQVILNKDTNVQCDPNLLPQPNHVMLNHMYALSIKDGVIVLSAITRYRQKFVSTVLYKPI